MKVVFLDRDGVINRYPGDTKYVTSAADFRFLPRVKEALARLHRHKFKIFIVSNQAGVGKGLYSGTTLDAITEKMTRAIERTGGAIEAVYYCTHRKEQRCLCRKPKTGLLEKARRLYPFAIKKTFFVGDTIRDVATARAFGCRSILVLSGKEKLSERGNWELRPDFVCDDLDKAVALILRQR